jgi:hypothetical protein
MKACGESARTSPREKTGAAPSVAKLAIDPNGGRGEFRALGGGKHDEWNQHLTAQLAGALPEARGSMTAATVEGSLGALTGQIGIDPQDPVEGMLSAQMIAANAAALDLYRRDWIPEQSFEVSTRYLALAEKAANARAAFRGARPSPRQRPTADHREARHGERRPGRRRRYRGGRQQGTHRDLQ